MEKRWRSVSVGVAALVAALSSVRVERAAGQGPRRAGAAQRVRVSDETAAPVPIRYVARPPSSFPVRDLLVLEQLPLGPQDRVCEIGIGSGQTLARLSQLCGAVTGLEISEKTVLAIKPLLAPHGNVRVAVADVTQPEQVAPFAGQFTRIVSADTVEHVADPGAFFRAVARLGAPGARFLLTFPNEPADRMHGITRFDSPEQLSRLLAEAGLCDVRLGAAQLNEHAEVVAEQLAWRPLRAVRAARRSFTVAPPAPTAAPQTFHETSFFRDASLWSRVSPAVNAYWWAVLRLMAAPGRAFSVDWDFARSDFRDAQLVITGRVA